MECLCTKFHTGMQVREDTEQVSSVVSITCPAEVELGDVTGV